MMRYKGYIGIAHVDMEAGVIRGKVVNVRDTITFQGETVAQASKAFEESVDDYLEFCASLGEKPEKPYSGKFLVRIAPEVHRDLTAAAQAQGISVNRLVARALNRVARKCRAFLVVKKAGGHSRAKKAGPESAGKKTRAATAPKPASAS
jgi:predicted HicB family RNase H-like nuclease